jgi:preprotein translocase subunit SecG
MTLVLLASSFWNVVMCTLLLIVAVFLILLVLVQRGRGGGLTGALGGMGGQSAFGTKAGDMFTRVTMITAGIWILLCMATIKLVGSQDPWGGSSKVKATTSGPADPGKEKDTGESEPGKVEDESASGDSKDAASTAGPADKESGDAAPADTSKAGDQPAVPAKE